MEPPPPSNEPWFWGTAPRAELDDAVRAGGKGDFAIREDRDGHFSLTVNDGSDLSRYKIRKTALGYEFAKAAFPTIDAVVRKLKASPFSSAAGAPLSLKNAVQRTSLASQQPPSMADRKLLMQRAEAQLAKDSAPARGEPAPGKRPTEEERIRLVQLAQQSKSKGVSTATPTTQPAAAKPAPATPEPSAATMAAANAAPGPLPPGAVRVKLTRTGEHGMGVRIGESGAGACVVKMILNPALESQLTVGQRLLAIGALDVSSMLPREISAVIRGMQSAVLVLQASAKARGATAGGLAPPTRTNGAPRNNKLEFHIAPLDVECFEKLDINRVTLDKVPVEARSRTLNRFLDILPNAATAVQLSELPMDRTSRYINANYVRGYSSPELSLHAESLEPERPRHYVAAQGPLVGTVDSFVRMIWELEICVIAQTTNFIEQNKRKCERYFPTEVGPEGKVTFEGISVVLLSSQVCKGYRISVLELSKGSQTRKVEHFWFVAWPDHGVPTDKSHRMYPKHVIEMLLKVRERREQLDKCTAPLLVHCSAGVGRTGTFIAIDHVISALLQRDRVDLNAIIAALRKDRMALVQHTVQYKFAYAACIEIAEDMIAKSGMGGEIYAVTPPPQKTDSDYEETEREDGEILFKHRRGSAIMADTEEDKPVFQEEEAMSPPVPAASAKAAAGRGACAGCALRDAQREVWCRICGAVADSADSAGGGADEGGDTRARKGSVLRAGLEDEPWYFGNLDRKGLGDMLADAPVGSFGIRISSQSGCYVLSYQQDYPSAPSKKRLQNILIKPIDVDGRRMYRLDQCADHDFVTVPDLVHFFQSNAVSYVDDETGQHHRIFLDNSVAPDD